MIRKLNNKGFAITGILYTLFILFILILVSILGGLQTKKQMLEKNTEKLIGQEHPQAKSLFRFTRSNLFEQVPWRFDVILTNPPYIPHTMVNELLKDGRSEPRLALDGDITETGDRAKINGYELDDGLTIIKNLIPQIKEHLNPKGTVLMETGEYNAQATAAWAKNWAFKTQIYPDLEGQLRVVEFK